MAQSYSVELYGEGAKPWIAALGADTAPIDTPIPEVITPPGGDRVGVFAVDWVRLTEAQKNGLSMLVARNFGISKEEAKASIPSQPVVLSAEICRMRRLSNEQIQMIRSGFSDNYKKKHPEADHMSEVFLVGREIICLLLGHDWWVRNVWEEMGQPTKRMAYLRLGTVDDKKRMESFDRVIDLADSLYALQHSVGFDFKLDEVRAISPEQPKVALEDLAIELQIAKMLVRSGNTIEFVIPTKIKGQDFDLRLDLQQGEQASVEIKCKREETCADASSLNNTLGDIRKQLPKGGPSLAFVRLPSEWISDQAFTSSVPSVLEAYFRNTTRVNAVILVWEEWLDLGETKRARVQRFKAEINPNPASRLPRLDKILPALDRNRVNEKAHFQMSYGDYGPSIVEN